MSSVPSGGLAVMQNRRDPIDSLDFFPTPPWATRSFCEQVMPQLGLFFRGCQTWEPAAGAGHMSRVLAEYTSHVFASDVHDYGEGFGVGSFVGDGPDVLRPFGLSNPKHRIDWIITNPPFSLAAEFALTALRLADRVALLVRTSWLEGGERFRTVFQPHPPLAVAQFCERVPMVKGRWDPDASTATSYAWVVWAQDEEPQPTRFLWIPPGQRKALTKACDAERFGGLHA
jgi:hypothetical protein